MKKNYSKWTAEFYRNAPLFSIMGYFKNTPETASYLNINYQQHLEYFECKDKSCAD
ncbi:hypothetical protein Lstg_3126 [Legionella steigerwaltii]|uniref:Uncharacterized protein n=1 Tax=Legionella steigerwaltii TaxID=460 RepID=A0ABR5RT70_9GAMM|nr:hypothetical protein Lstg_3126 [Legionella steigerwaltii]